jgi:hypothetical protein
MFPTGLSVTIESTPAGFPTGSSRSAISAAVGAGCAGLIARPYAPGAASVARRDQGYWLGASHRVTCRKFHGNGD